MSKWRAGLPIGVQLVGLLMASLIAAQLISLAIILLVPPPRPPLYRASEVAAALSGGSLESRFGRDMIRTSAETLPPELQRRAPLNPVTLALAQAVGAPLADVRLAQHHGPPFRRMMVGLRPDRPPPGERMLFIAANGPPMGPGEPVPRFPDAPIVGDFTAAVRTSEGTWSIVRSTPEPFPNDWQRRSLMWLLAGFLIVAPAGFLFARRITAPLQRFSDAAEALGRDPQAPQMTLSGPAEIGVAARAFNEMQSRLKRYVSDRTAMVGAISHDLRTPLARIRFKMEAAEPQLREAVIKDVAQMEQMIAGVLAFIRNESQPRRREKLELLSLIECVTDDAALVGADVELASGEPVTVEGDPVGLQRLFANLVDNAVKYGEAARITVAQEDGLAVVRIRDRGPGLSVEDLERVFQPFYRVDAARNLDSAGVGLGLPIARATARAHGGDVELASSAKGVTATVTLPAFD